MKRIRPADYKRQTVHETVYCELLDDDIVQGPEKIDDVILRLQAIKKKHTKKDVTVFLDVEYYGYDGGRDYSVVLRRPETDAEMKKRIAKEEAAYEKKMEAKRKKEEKALQKVLDTEEKERALLAQLKAKYEA